MRANAFTPPFSPPPHSHSRHRNFVSPVRLTRCPRTFAAMPMSDYFKECIEPVALRKGRQLPPGSYRPDKFVTSAFSSWIEFPRARPTLARCLRGRDQKGSRNTPEATRYNDKTSGFSRRACIHSRRLSPPGRRFPSPVAAIQARCWSHPIYSAITVGVSPGQVWHSAEAGTADR